MVTKKFIFLLLLRAILFGTVFFLTGCSAKTKIVEASNDFIVFVARMVVMAIGITVLANGIMYIIRAMDGENSIPVSIILRIVVVVILGVITLFTPQIFDSVTDIVGYNLMPSVP